MVKGFAEPIGYYSKTAAPKAEWMLHATSESLVFFKHKEAIISAASSNHFSHIQLPTLVDLRGAQSMGTCTPSTPVLQM